MLFSVAALSHLLNRRKSNICIKNCLHFKNAGSFYFEKLLKNFFVHDISRATFYLEQNLTDVFADNPDTEDLQPSDKYLPNSKRTNIICDKFEVENISEDKQKCKNQTQERNNRTYEKYDIQRSCAKRNHTVECHFRQRNQIEFRSSKFTF